MLIKSPAKYYFSIILSDSLSHKVTKEIVPRKETYSTGTCIVVLSLQEDSSLRDTDTVSIAMKKKGIRLGPVAWTTLYD